MKKTISLKDLGMEITKDTKIILRSRPLGRECPVLKEVREWIKNNPKEAEAKNLVDVDGRAIFAKKKQKSMVLLK